MKQFYSGKEEIFNNLKLVSEELKALDMHGEILITGGASMCLVFSARSATKDIDAIYEPKSVINDIAAKIAFERRATSLKRYLRYYSLKVILLFRRAKDIL